MQILVNSSLSHIQTQQITYWICEPRLVRLWVSACSNSPVLWTVNKWHWKL